MPYIGKEPANSFISFEKQVFTIVNSQTAYTLDNAVTNENDIRLVINNIVQEPGSGKAYTASGTTLTLSAALVNGTDEMYCVFLGKAVQTVNTPDGSVNTSKLVADAITEAKIADDAVESEHLNNNIISGQTELAVAPASTDELLISDGGVLKRIDFSLIGGNNKPIIVAARSGGDQTVSAGSYTKVQLNDEVLDTGSNYNNSTYIATIPEAGTYFLGGFITVTNLNGTSDFAVIRIADDANSSSKRYANSAHAGNSGYGTVNLSTFSVRTLAQNDTVSLFVYGSEGITVQDESTQLVIYKLIT